MTMRRYHPTLLVLLGLLPVVAACSESGTEPGTSLPTASALRITPQTLSLRLGESSALEVEFVDAVGRPVTTSDSVTWSSSAPAVIGVDETGVVEARAIGTATVEARSGTLTGTSEVTVLSPSPQSGTNSPVSMVIDSAGGTITATSADGTRYTLEVPRHALREPTEIRLTPLASIEHFPTAAGASAAVLFEPDGLTFTVPAELTIVAPTSFAPTSVAFSQSADAFLLGPARLSADTARLLIGHFSSGGTTAPTPEEVAALMPGGGSAENSARHGVTQELIRASQAGEHPDVNVIAQHLKDWFDNGVLPGLEAAASGQRDVEDAIGEWMRWLTNLQSWADGHLEAEVSRGDAATAVALRAGIDRLNQQCIDRNDASLVDEILHLAALSAFLGADAIDPTLDLDAVFANLCVRIAIEATLPDPFVQGGTLQVRAGFAIGEHPPSYGTALDITLQSTTAHLSRTAGTTEASGEFTAEVELRDGHDEVVIEIEAVHPTNPRMRATERVTSRARYELDLTVEGGKITTIETGDVAILEASLRKAEAPLSNATISLSLLGGGSLDAGSITTDAAGLGASRYTAPDVGDTVRVVASFTEGSEVLMDTVTIEVTEVPKGRIRIDDISRGYTASAGASQGQLPASVDHHSPMLNETGTLSGSYTASAASGSASSNGSTTHESSIIHSDTDTLLVLQSKGASSGTVSANRALDSGSTLYVGSDTHIYFEVLDAPVFFEVTGHGVTEDAGGSGVELSSYSGRRYVIKDWHSTPDSLDVSGWLEPGFYRFHAAGSVWIGAGRNNTYGDDSARGMMSYEVRFLILDREPREEPTLPKLSRVEPLR